MHSLMLLWQRCSEPACHSLSPPSSTRARSPWRSFDACGLLSSCEGGPAMEARRTEMPLSRAQARRAASFSIRRANGQKPENHPSEGILAHAATLRSHKARPPSRAACGKCRSCISTASNIISRNCSPDHTAPLCSATAARLPKRSIMPASETQRITQAESAPALLTGTSCRTVSDHHGRMARHGGWSCIGRGRRRPTGRLWAAGAPRSDALHAGLNADHHGVTAGTVR